MTTKTIKTLSGLEVEIDVTASPTEIENAIAKKHIAKTMEKLNKIDQKNQCVRVKFLDWLAAQLLHWSNLVKARADKIQSPCILVVPKKK